MWQIIVINYICDVMQIYKHVIAKQRIVNGSTIDAKLQQKVMQR